MTVKLPDLVQTVKINNRQMIVAAKQAKVFGDQMAALRRELARPIEAEFEVDGAEAVAEIATVKRQLKDIDRSKTTADIDVPTAKPLAGIAAIRAALRDVGGKKGAGFSLPDPQGIASLVVKVQALAAAVPVAVTALGALGAGAVSATAALAPAAGAAVSFGAAMIAVKSGAAVFTQLTAEPIAAAAALQGLKVGTDEYKEALEGLPAPARDFAINLAGLQEQMTNIRTEAQARTLPVFAEALKTAGDLAPLARDGFLGVSDSLGKVAVTAANAATAPMFKAELGQVVNTNSILVENFGRAGVSLATAFVTLLAAAQPLTLWLGDLAQKGAENLAVMTAQGRESSALAIFFIRTRTVLTDLGNAVKDFGVGLFNIFSIGGEQARGFTGALADGAAKFREFTESSRGVEAIRGYFESAQPILREVGLLVRDLVKAFGGLSTSPGTAALIAQLRVELLPSLLRLMQAGAELLPTVISLVTAFTDFAAALGFSPLAAVADGLATVVSWVARLISAVPGLGEVIATMLTLKLGITGVMLAARATGLTSLVSGLGSVVTAAGPAILAGARVALGWVAMGASAVAAGARVVGAWVLMGAQALLGAARIALAWVIAMGPIAIVIAAVIGLGVIIYKNWDQILAWTKAAWTNITNFVSERATAIKNWVVGQFTQLRDIGASIITGFVNGIVSLWNNLFARTSAFFEMIRAGVVQRFTALRDGAVNIVVNLVADLMGRWENFRTRVVDAATRIKDGIVGAFNVLPRAVGDIFNTMVDKVSGPIGTLKRWINDNLIGNLNKVTKVFGLTIPTLADGGLIQAQRFAVGGRVTGPGGPREDKVPAWLSSGEFVVNAAATAANLPLLKALNSRGGVGPRRDPGTGGPLDTIKGRLSAGVDQVQEWLLSGVKKAVEKIVGGAAGLVGRAVPAPPFANQMAVGAVKKIAELATAFGGKKDSEAGSLGGGAINAPGVGVMMSLLRSRFPGLRLNSGFRPGAITATGNRSMHALGRAVDVPPRMDVFNWIAANFGRNTKELIFSPAGGRQIHNGKPHMYTGVTRANHFDHVHWGYRDGGQVGKPTRHDTGGMMAPNSFGFNGTTRPEPVFTGQQWDIISAALLDRTRAAPPARAQADLAAAVTRLEATLAGMGAGSRPVIVNAAFNNPSTERDVVTLNRTMQRSGALGAFQ